METWFLSTLGKCFRTMKSLLHFWVHLNIDAINLCWFIVSTWSWNGVNEGSSQSSWFGKKKWNKHFYNLGVLFLIISGSYQPGEEGCWAPWWIPRHTLFWVSAASHPWNFCWNEFILSCWLPCSLVFDLQIWSILKQSAVQNLEKYFWQNLFLPISLKDLFTFLFGAYLLLHV